MGNFGKTVAWKSLADPANVVGSNIVVCDTDTKQVASCSFSNVMSIVYSQKKNLVLL